MSKRCSSTLGYTLRSVCAHSGQILSQVLVASFVFVFDTPFTYHFLFSSVVGALLAAVTRRIISVHHRCPILTIFWVRRHTQKWPHSYERDEWMNVRSMRYWPSCNRWDRQPEVNRINGDFYMSFLLSFFAFCICVGGCVCVRSDWIISGVFGWSRIHTFNAHKSMCTHNQTDRQTHIEICHKYLLTTCRMYIWYIHA